VPPPPGFGAAGYPPGYQPGAVPFAVSQPPASNGAAVASLVVGILSLLGIFCIGIGGVALGLIAVVLGIMGVRKANELAGQPQKGLAIGGLVTGAIGLLVGAAFLGLVVLGSTVSDDYDSGYNTDPPDGVCDQTRFVQDPDC
jgi:hypothetical protein